MRIFEYFPTALLEKTYADELAQNGGTSAEAKALKSELTTRNVRCDRIQPHELSAQECAEVQAEMGEVFRHAVSFMFDDKLQCVAKELGENDFRNFSKIATSEVRCRKKLREERKADNGGGVPVPYSV